ncbi:hypothetical protein FOA52_004827 [Chlamydomonas sp. UWO 241]|nr:hypothetical protein FOA52_004827 [Chlamydomonas sp. UWO 241]
MSKIDFIRGLQNFIQEIRACTNKEQEDARIFKELGKIRSKFAEDSGLSNYDRRKYVWKLLYIHMLGHKIDFGFKQCCDLIPMPKYKDKQVGYMACSILLHENDESSRQVIYGVHLDLMSRNEAFECLALSFIGSVGGAEMAAVVVPDIVKFLDAGGSRPVVKKRAALALLRMVRKAPVETPAVTPAAFAPVLNRLLEELDLGLLLCSVTLLCGLASRYGPAGYESTQSRLIRILERMTTSKDRDIPVEYLYYGIPSPWLHAKCLRALQFFPAPEAAADRATLSTMLQFSPAPEVRADRVMLSTMLQSIIDNNYQGDSSKPNKANAVYSIMLEAVALALTLGDDKRLAASSASALGRFLQSRDPNIKYLTMQMLSGLVGNADLAAAMRPHMGAVAATMRDPDITLRKQALNLTFNMCDPRNVGEVVGNMLADLPAADLSTKEDLVLKIAILTEKHSPSVHWYIETTVRLMESAGELVSDDMWQTAVEAVGSNEGVQPTACRATVAALRRGASSESLLCFASYVLGRFGKDIKGEVPLVEQHRLLASPMQTASASSKGVTLSALIKLYLAEPSNLELRRATLGLFERSRTIIDPQAQARAAEVLVAAEKPGVTPDALVFDMPVWPQRLGSMPAPPNWASNAAFTPDGAHAGLSPVASGGQSREVTQPPPALHAANPSAMMAFDLLGGEAAGSSFDPFAVLQTSSAHVPASLAGPPRATPVDLLSDLFADTSIPAAAPAAAPVYSQHSAPAPPTTSSNPFASSPTASQVPYPAFPAYPPVGSSASVGASNPFGTLAPPPPPAPLYGGVAPGVAAGAAAGAAAGGDLFGGSAFGAAPALPPRTFEAAVPDISVETRFQGLLYKDRGVIYEDQYLQVGCLASYPPGACTGTLTLFFGNKVPDAPLTGVRLAVGGGGGVAASLSGPVPETLSPKEQVKVPIDLTAFGPVTEPPQLMLSYTIGNVCVEQGLKVPVASHRFVVPEASIAKELFFEQWKAIGDAANRSQEMVARDNGPISVADVPEPNRPAVQAAFIEERIRPLAAGQTHLVLAGDFNFVESPRDRARSEGPLEWRDRAPAAAMAALVEDSPLRDAYRLIHPMQRGYTFSAYNAQARLDRLYVSMALVPRVLGGMADIMADAVAAVSRPPPLSPADREAVLGAVRAHSPRVPQAVADAAGALVVTPAEVRAAATHSKPGTAPGPDGIPVDVWRKLGEPAFELLAAVFTAVGATGGTPHGFLDGVVASIYKAKNAADAANYRPLTMLGSDYRILAKVLATRWTPLLSAVVGPEQTAFLAGRRISDNICLTQMLPGLLAANAADGVGPTGAALALLDFRKAYDTIDRGFLIAVMEAVGVGDGVLAWTRTILTHTYASAEVNGFISAPRKYAAGVFAGLRGLEAAVPTLWRMPLLNARKEPIWRLWVLRSANLGVEPGYLDPSPFNEAGAGYFVCQPAGGDGEPTRTLVMCRVEGNPQDMSQFRVTVVSALPALSQTTKDLVVLRLRELTALAK